MAPPRPSSATTRATPTGSGATPATPSPKTASTTTSSTARATVNPDRSGTKAALWYRLEVAAGETAEIRLRLAADPVRPRRRLVGDDGRPPRRGRRVLRRRRARGHAGREPGDAAGLRRDALEQAVLPLRRGPLAGRRSGRAASPDRAAHRAQPPLAPPLQPAGDLDARQVGVPVVRRVGPLVPLRDARAGRSGVRQGSAAPDHARVVHARQRPAAGLRVGLRRRQPAGPRPGGPAGVPGRRRA